MKVWIYTFVGNIFEIPRGWDIRSISLGHPFNVAILTQEVSS